MSFAEFCERYPSHSIALDGFVRGGPEVCSSSKGVWANFNHHEDVNRLAARATCAQVLMAIRQGLFSSFTDAQVPHSHVYVNDCDEDVCTAWFLLKNFLLVRSTMNPILNRLLNRLVAMEDALDSTAGAYPFPADLPMLAELNWVFEPYRQHRVSGNARTSQEVYGVIERVERRIMQHITGMGKAVPLDTRYHHVPGGGGTGWSFVVEEGANARTGMFSDGIRAYVAIRGGSGPIWGVEGEKLRITYTVGRMSPFVPFDVKRILVALQAAEVDKRRAIGVELPPGDVWGGSEDVGGSPRVSQSYLYPNEVRAVVERCVSKGQ